jgi:hypothetical protein
MKILRIKNVKINDSTEIEISFTDDLVPNLVTSNISIISDTDNIPDAQVTSITINGNVLTVVCQPLSPMSAYFIRLQSTDLHPFISLHGESKIMEDGISNKYLILAPLAPENPVKGFLESFFKDNIYDTENDTIISKYLSSISIALSKALYDIRQIKNENYLSFTIEDEKKVRGIGPFDRLNEESAYQIIRVGQTPTGTNASSNIEYSTFPSSPVTLQKQNNIEIVTYDTSDEVGKFNINNLTFNLSNSPVTKVTSIIFTFASANPIYNYDIETLGYQILDSRYDQDFSFSYLLLKDNQVRINDKVLEDPDFTLDNLLNVQINYESKNLGIVVNSNSVNVTTSIESIRETLPPITNVFSLQHAPIVDQGNNIAVLSGITFKDPNSNLPNAKHPAFLSEIPFKLDSLPFIPGQYSIDYTNGTIYVYGQDSTNDGTGPSPPLATYRYRLTYKSEIDYVYDEDLLDLVALPNGSLINFPGTINFQYEKVLIPNVDYKANLHSEELSERIENRLVALNVFKTKNSPITDVFRIYNETSGEIYSLDRWSDNKVYFRYNNPPKLNSFKGERVSFNDVTNELLFVDTSSVNSSSLIIFKILLKNNNIISSTEDLIGSSFNTSIVFSNGNTFIKEKWFNKDLEIEQNLDRLIEIGQYTIDYINGIIYCAVSANQDFNIGTVSYKNNSIVPSSPHLISVEDIYYRISVLNPKNKQFAYSSFNEGSIISEEILPSDEVSLNGSIESVYQLYNGDIGAFVDSTFIPGVTNQVKFVRSVYEYEDLLNSTNPLNFAQYSLAEDFNISTSSINKETYESVKYDGNYYININENIPYFSSNISYTFSIIRTSDSAELWNGSGTIIPGNELKLVLPGINSPTLGDLVHVVYTFEINDLSRIVIDYNKGDLFIDYTSVIDEIIVSYEYGDNLIDFRSTNNVVSSGDTYYVSYKAGALRDALLNNFGTLVNIPELINFDIDFNRERYRDALTAALSSFIQGPTLNAIKNIGKTISHIEPEITESVFENWSLGNSLLVPQNIQTTGDIKFLSAKFGNGALINESNQTIKMPVNSNIRLEEGTFESWILPQWNGLDNDADLTFTILRDGYAIEPYRIFVGAGEFHPTLSSDGKFTINKNDNVVGSPNSNKDGIFIYYDKDLSGDYNRWYVDVIDGYVNDGYSSDYKIVISTTGKFYDSKSVFLPKPSNMKLTTATKNLTINIVGGEPINEGVTFLSDSDHYILDFGKNTTSSRLSLLKDPSGYIIFKTIDKDGVVYAISADVSSWKSNELHHVAISWKLNTRNNKDEMHLFIDGFEVPNIIKYSQKLQPYLHEKFRTINKEELIGSIDRDIVGSVDLSTMSGSPLVTSSINFSAFNIYVGDTIYIDEVGFNTSGYLINNINGQELTLNSNMPETLSDARFSINRTNFNVSSDIDISTKTTVSSIHKIIDGSDLIITANSNMIYSSTTNFEDEGVEAGYSIMIDDASTTEIIYTILSVSGNELLISDNMTASNSNINYRVYDNEENELSGIKALRPDYSFSKQDFTYNNILTISNNVFAGDIINVKTYGLNSRRIKKQHYIWSDGYENILMTQLPPPISLDELKITKVILPSTIIGPSNSTIIIDSFQSNNITVYQPSISVEGRQLKVNISGSNVDFSSSVQVNIIGTVGLNSSTETLTFSDYGEQVTLNNFTQIDSINVLVKPINVSKAALVIGVKENSELTKADELTDGYADGYTTPVIRYSYHIGGNYTLKRDSDDSVRDENNYFSGLYIGNYLWIHSPSNVAGYYLITAISEDLHSITIEPINAVASIPLPAFTNGIYQILNVSEYRSGLQNGFITFEQAISPGQPYYLNSGFYEIDYASYARIKFDPINSYVYLGSSLEGAGQLNGVIDQVKIYSTMLSDTRVGESIPSNQRSITKDFNSLKELKADPNTLVLIDFNNDILNSAKFYTNTNTSKHFQSTVTVNENFENSLVILDKPIVVSNNGILNTRKSGTIEFWMSPIYDSSNDPNTRFYFDAFGAVTEEAVSINNVSIKISSPASQILSVKLKAGNQSIDYFAGGKLEIDTQNAIQEEGMSINNSSMMTSKPILQVISVKIEDDPTGIDYFANGSVGTDLRTIYLGKTLPQNSLSLIVTYQTTENLKVKQNSQIIRLNKELPYQNAHVVVNYIPKGLQGDRISIFKDQVGYINFAVNASGTDYVLRAPTHWVRDTWHRVKASYKFNGGQGTDEMRLFLDGYEFTNVQFGSGIIFGENPIVMGASMPGDGYNFIGNISFKDQINEMFIGTQYNEQYPAFTLIDNFRISNISRPIYAPYGEPLDVNYSNNLDIVYPVTEDLYTTFLLNFNSLYEVSDDFAVIKNRNNGSFDFSINILDSLDVINDNAKVKEVLEKLLKVLKPANSRIYITYQS